MVKRNLQLAIQAARSLTLIGLLLCHASVTTCSAVEFGFLVEEFDTETPYHLAQVDESNQDANRQIAENELEAEEELAGPGRTPETSLFPEVVGGQFRLPALTALTTATAQIGNGRTPDSFRGDQPTNVIPLPESASERGQPWDWTMAQWAAANTFSYPLYFEDRMLERHGQRRLGKLQPAASMARFLSTFPMLPYLTAVNAPCECEYTLGYYRSGSCAPVMMQRPPWERRAVINEVLWMSGGIAILP